MSNSNLGSDNPIYHQILLNDLAGRDMALAHNPPALDEPFLMEHVTPALVEIALRGMVKEATITNLSTDQAHIGMTSRQRMLIQWNAAGKQAELPTSVFIKATPDTLENREMLSVLHMDEMECRFYSSIRQEFPDIAPQSYYARYYSGGRFLIFVEDLEASQCKPFWLASDCSIAHAKAVAVALATLHSPYWQSERLVNDLAWLKPWNRRYGWQWLFDLAAQGRQAFLSSPESETCPADVIDLIRLWDKHAQTGYDYFANLPRTVIHGDSHLGNTYSRPDGQAGLYDWQVMFSATGLRDLNYFLYSALTDENRKTHEKEIFSLYLETLAEGGVKLDAEIAWNDYCLLTMDRWDTALITLLGEYGHDRDAQFRGIATNIGATLDNDVAGRVRHLIR